MASNNPAFTRGELFTDKGSSPLSVSSGEVLTHENAIQKTVMLFGVLLACAAVGWMLPVLAIAGAVVGLVLGIINAFRKTPSVPLIIAYAAFEGLFVGGISAIFELTWPGVVVQAVLATLVTVGVVLALFASGKIRASAKATKIFLIAMVSYLLFSLLNFGLMIFGVLDAPFGLRSADIPGTNIPFGVVIGVLAVIMASYSLVLDFDYIQQGVRNQIPVKFGWQAGFGILVTVVWIYVEFLRLFALFRD
jgi:uncharacterized YccA/Bax inhibitor family protein